MRASARIPPQRPLVPPLPPSPSVQHSALSVAAFEGPRDSSSVPAGCPASGRASAANGSSNAAASASQLASVYVLPGALPLEQLAGMEGRQLETQAGGGWQLAVHVGPPAVQGVSGRPGAGPGWGVLCRLNPPVSA